MCEFIGCTSIQRLDPYGMGAIDFPLSTYNDHLLSIYSPVIRGARPLKVVIYIYIDSIKEYDS